MEIKIYVNPHSESGKSETSFRFKGYDKIYNSFKTEKDEFNLIDIEYFTVYSDEEVNYENLVEEFKSTLPKYLHNYIYVSTTVNWLNDEGYSDYSKSQPCITISCKTNHHTSEAKLKVIKRLNKEVLKFFK